MASDLPRNGVALFEANTAYLLHLQAAEHGEPGVARAAISNVCAYFGLRVVPLAGNPSDEEPNPRLDTKQTPAANRALPDTARRAPREVTGVAFRAPSAGEFDYVTLWWLRAMAPQGASREDLMVVFQELDLDVGKPTAFATRLNSRLKGGADNTKGLVTWNANRRHPRASITDKGLSDLKEMEKCEASSALTLSERDALLPLLQTLVEKPPTVRASE